jgi:hypothetical protein
VESLQVELILQVQKWPAGRLQSELQFDFTRAAEVACVDIQVAGESECGRKPSTWRVEDGVVVGGRCELELESFVTFFSAIRSPEKSFEPHAKLFEEHDRTRRRLQFATYYLRLGKALTLLPIIFLSLSSPKSPRAQRVLSLAKAPIRKVACPAPSSDPPF